MRRALLPKQTFATGSWQRNGRWMSPIAFDNSYARLPGHFYAKVHPAQVPEPKLLRLNERLAETLGLDVEWLRSTAGLMMLSGNSFPDGCEPLAQAYAGHQFGGWVPQLGDGRAILLGEVIAKDGIRRDIQLKGSGRTPFSRGGDGKAAIGPVLREYVLSEAMAALGVPTTRALAAVSTGELVRREVPLPGGILTRVAKSHLRVGTFQFFYAQQDVEALRVLADHAIELHYPDAKGADQPYRAFLEGVVAAQASLIAQWMHLGFIHGVMNTDNMTVSGETIDYGPCAFMDDFHPEKVFSSIDRNRRYAWSNQPVAGHWNLSRLAEALMPLLSDDPNEAKSIAESVVGCFGEEFSDQHAKGFREKLGLNLDASANDQFISDTLAMLADHKIDFTVFFRELTRVATNQSDSKLVALFGAAPAFDSWFADWRERTGGAEEDVAIRVAAMQARNPIRIPRNHRVEEAIQSALRGDIAPFHRLVEATAEPYAEAPEFEDMETVPSADQVVCETFCGT